MLSARSLIICCIIDFVAPAFIHCCVVLLVSIGYAFIRKRVGNEQSYIFTTIQSNRIEIFCKYHTISSVVMENILLKMILLSIVIQVWQIIELNLNKL